MSVGIVERVPGFAPQAELKMSTPSIRTALQETLRMATLPLFTAPPALFRPFGLRMLIEHRGGTTRRRHHRSLMRSMRFLN
jgi:hypothetical protein